MKNPIVKPRHFGKLNFPLHIANVHSLQHFGVIRYLKDRNGLVKLVHSVLAAMDKIV